MALQSVKSSESDYNRVQTFDVQSPPNAQHRHPFHSRLVGKYIKLKNIGNDTYEIESITMNENDVNESKNENESLPELVQESTNKWLFMKDFACDGNRNTCKWSKTWTNFSIAIIVIFIQLLSYIIMAYYLIARSNGETGEREEKCYGPNCHIKQPKCMHISPGGITGILLVGFLWADIINTFSMIKYSIKCNGKRITKYNKYRLIASVIIFIELMTALICGILVGLYSETAFDAINGAVGILFVHDLDEKIYLAMDAIKKDDDEDNTQQIEEDDHSNKIKILALVSWIILSFIIAASCACVYNNGFWLSFTGHCKKGNFKCDDGECIWYGFVCNGVRDCADGEDEAGNCDFSLIQCPSDKFRCESDGSCINLEKRCDGILHCNDGTDEVMINCIALISNITCGNATFESVGNNGYLKVSEGSMFKCNNGQCIDARFMCDGIQGDCIDRSDEYPYFNKLNDWPFLNECPYDRLIQCGIDQVLCKLNGKCISKMRICDESNDCPNGEDERGCTNVNEQWYLNQCQTGAKFQCGGNIAKFDKNNSEVILFENETIIKYDNIAELAIYTITDDNTVQCIPWQWRCDGIMDCHDGTDENVCWLFECNDDDEFQCLSGECIPKHWRCDNHEDCDSGDDEDNCNSTQYTNMLIERLKYLTCNDTLTIGEISEYLWRQFYSIYIPCPYKAAQFTTCNEKTSELNTYILMWQSDRDVKFNFFENIIIDYWWNDDAYDTDWPCNINSFASTITLNDNQFVCDRWYNVLITGKYIKESIGTYGFQLTCSETNF